MSSLRTSLGARSSLAGDLSRAFLTARTKIGYSLGHPTSSRSSVPVRSSSAASLPQEYLNAVRCSAQLDEVTSHRAPPSRASNTTDIPTKRVHNFSAGPGPIPQEVMMEAQKNFSDHHGAGMGFMEMSHRDVDGPVQGVMRETESLLRQLLGVPRNFKIIFMQGGAHGQFAAVPLNLAEGFASADYVNTGFWSERSINEASRYLHCNVVSDAKSVNHQFIPSTSEWRFGAKPAYTYLCGNETIHGLEVLEDIDIPTKSPVVADFTSTLLSRPIDFSKYGVVFASAGKNLGPAGVNVTIVREDLLGRAASLTPSVLNWTIAAETNSLYNTPPTYLIYMMNLVLKWTAEKGGVSEMESRAKRRSDYIYDIVDNSDGFYSNHVRAQNRSRMNVPFRIGRGIQSFEKRFSQEAEEHGIFQLTGHHLFGGLRATLYNGVADDSVYALGPFMKDFQSKYSGYVSDEDKLA